VNTYTMLRTTITLGLSLLALTTAAWAQTNGYPPGGQTCKLEQFNIRYYASDADTYHYKRVVAYCEPNEKAISCEADTFASPDYRTDTRYKYFVALNALYEFHDKAQQRWGCVARANTFYSTYADYHGETGGDYPSESDFYWGLKVYATCVPLSCVKQYAGEGTYEFFDHPTSEEPPTPEEPPVP
jgi:hypothetical protein